MYKNIWNAAILLLAFYSVGVAAEDVPARTKNYRIAPLQKQTIPAIKPQAKPVSIGVVGADIRSNGYTIEIRNDSSTTSGPLTVQVAKCKNDNSCATGGAVGVESLGAGASTEVSINQPQGWNTGYTGFMVYVIERVNGQDVNVGQRGFSIPSSLNP